jgi:hypothetical protein
MLEFVTIYLQHTLAVGLANIGTSGFNFDNSIAGDTSQDIPENPVALQNFATKIGSKFADDIINLDIDRQILERLDHSIFPFRLSSMYIHFMRLSNSARIGTCVAIGPERLVPPGILSYV